MITKTQIAKEMVKTVAKDIGAAAYIAGGGLARLVAMPVVGNLPHEFKEQIYNEDKSEEKPWTGTATVLSELANITAGMYAASQLYAGQHKGLTGIVGALTALHTVGRAICAIQSRPHLTREDENEEQVPCKNWWPGSIPGYILSLPAYYLRNVRDRVKERLEEKISREEPMEVKQ